VVDFHGYGYTFHINVEGIIVELITINKSKRKPRQTVVYLDGSTGRSVKLTKHRFIFKYAHPTDDSYLPFLADN